MPRWSLWYCLIGMHIEDIYGTGRCLYCGRQVRDVTHA